jgi:hypothetical protein
MIYDKYKQGALSAVQTFVTNKSSPKGMAPITAKSHLLNSRVNPAATIPQLQNDMSQEDRASSLAQESLGSNSKLGLDQSKSCTSCRKPQHYGNCIPDKHSAETTYIRMKNKSAEFNRSMLGSDSTQQDSRLLSSTGLEGKLLNDISTDPKQQANSAFKTFQQAYDTMVVGEGDHMSGALNKTAEQEILGPTVNPYAEMITKLKPITMRMPMAKDQISLAFDSFKIPSDTNSAENSHPESGPLL